jgi:hypothetical protein
MAENKTLTVSVTATIDGKVHVRIFSEEVYALRYAAALSAFYSRHRRESIACRFISGNYWDAIFAADERLKIKITEQYIDASAEEPEKVLALALVNTETIPQEIIDAIRKKIAEEDWEGAIDEWARARGLL